LYKSTLMDEKQQNEISVETLLYESPDLERQIERLRFEQAFDLSNEEDRLRLAAAMQISPEEIATINRVSGQTRPIKFKGYTLPKGKDNEV